MAAHCVVWVLLATIADALIIDINDNNGSVDALATYVCNVPVLGSTLEQFPTPNYQFSLARGGIIEGTLVVSSAAESSDQLDGGKPRNTVDDVKKMFASEQRNRSIQLRQRFKARKTFENHYNWLSLARNAFNLFFSSHASGLPAQESDVARNDLKDKRVLDNVYLILLSKAQFDSYFSSDYENLTEPARNSNQFVYNSHIIADMRIPIPAIGEPITFSYKARDVDRFALIIFNADERQLLFNGKVTFLNPGNDHLPVEMKYYKDVITFWEVVYLLTGFCFMVYLLVFCESTAKVVNHMLALNFLMVALYLQLDRALLRSIRETGSYSGILWTLAHLVRRFHEIYIMTTLVLLALGWKVLREHLTETEVRIVLSVCTFSSVVGFIEILVNGIDVSRYVVNTMSFIAILIATNFNTIVIHSRVIEESLSVQAGLAYSLMKTYGSFRIAFFAYIFKPILYSSLRAMCLQLSAEQVFVWDEHLMLFLDLMFNYCVYCIYFVAFMPISQLPLFKHLFATDTQCERGTQ
ncbi:putative membrane protein [Babesia divergens]|uniref:Membrane protein n=1 Tax=Babesia divergens TaxID=32595 RepID=A0AAD9GCI8_BABDI|nr:putative membrane protein [Babesia divergens]